MSLAMLNRLGHTYEGNIASLAIKYVPGPDNCSESHQDLCELLLAVEQGTQRDTPSLRCDIVNTLN